MGLHLVIIHVTWIFHYKPSMNWGISIFMESLIDFGCFTDAKKQRDFTECPNWAKMPTHRTRPPVGRAKRWDSSSIPEQVWESPVWDTWCFTNNHLLNTLIVSGYLRIDHVSSSIHGIWLTKQIQAYWASNIYWTSFIMSLFELAIWFCLQHGILDKHTQILLFSHQLF